MRSYFERAAERFWSKVHRKGDDECWPWCGTLQAPNNVGARYGNFCIYEDGKNISYRAHRFSWILANGSIPEGLVIMHTCDNTECVNPNHLELGTQLDNVQDRDDGGQR